MAMKQCVLIFMPGDTSQIALWQPHSPDDASWCTRAVLRGERGQSNGNRVLQAVDALLHDAHVTQSHITHIGVMRGPASYTELRLFVTTANTLAWTHGLPLFAFDPMHQMPQDLPELLVTAKVNQQIEPVYPPLQGA